MDFMLIIKSSALFFVVTMLSGCAALDIKPWSSEDFIDATISSVITGNDTSYGNGAACNQMKMVCKGRYREWLGCYE